MYEVPTTIKIGEQQFAIRNKGDYRMVLDCFSALGDAELNKQERLFSSLIIFYDSLEGPEDIGSLGNIETAVKEMYNFFNCGQPESMGSKTNHKLIDWDQDSQLISSAVNKVAGTEIRSIEYLHWWTFMGYYTAIGESPISNIIHIRDKIVKGEKLEKWERKFRTNNPQFFTWNSKSVDEQEADELVKQLWNKE